MSKNQKNNLNVTFNGNVENSNVTTAGGDIGKITNSDNFKNNEISIIFETIYTKIQNRQDDKNVDKAEIIHVVKNIEEEVRKNGSANEDKLNRWLRFLGEIAPDILDVVIKTLSNPLSGIADVVKKIFEKAKSNTKGA